MNLGSPIFGHLRETLWAQFPPVPERAIHKYGDLGAFEDNIRLARQIGDMESVPQATSPQCTPQNDLRFRVLRSYLRHDLTAFRFRHPISQSFSPLRIPPCDCPPATVENRSSHLRVPHVSA